MKKVLVGAMALLSLAACSNEEVLQKNEVNQEIGFTAVTGKALSRAKDGYCNKSMPGAITVSASYTDGGVTSQYFLNDIYDHGSGSEYTANGQVRYWPDLTGGVKMRFYAAVNATPAWISSTDFSNMKVTDFTVDKTVSQQKDFIFATKEIEDKPDEGKLAINFRHALSQIVFKAQNKNKNIYVEIEGVSVCEVKNKGTFTFPTDNTDGNIEDTNHANPYDPTAATTGLGSWDLGATYEDAYAVTFTAVGLNANQTQAQSLTYINDSGKEFNGNTMYLMPQLFTADDVWNPSATPYKKPGTTDGKAYFLVKAKIWNIASPNPSDDVKGGCDTGAGKDVVVWGKTGAADIAIPIPADTEWKQGKKYVYTFTFTTTGEGGWDPTVPDKPTHVLTPIKLSVTVDDFAAESETEVPMK